MVSTSTRESGLYRVPVTAVGERRRPLLRGEERAFFVPDRSAAPNGTDRPTTHKIISSWSARCNGARPSGSNPRARSRARRDFNPRSVGRISINPFNVWGKADPVFQWAGWLDAVDADSGQWRWRAKTNYPVQSGVAPTAGGLGLFWRHGRQFLCARRDLVARRKGSSGAWRRSKTRDAPVAHAFHSFDRASSGYMAMKAIVGNTQTEPEPCCSDPSSVPWSSRESESHPIQSRASIPIRRHILIRSYRSLLMLSGMMTMARKPSSFET